MNIKRNKKKVFNVSNFVFKLKEIGEIIKNLLGADFKVNFLKLPLSKINLETTKAILANIVCNFKTDSIINHIFTSCLIFSG